jgi:hypothetical protein
MFNFFIVTYAPFSVFCVLFICICVLYCCHRVSTQLRLNISYHIYRIATTGLYTVKRLSYGNKVWECGLDAFGSGQEPMAWSYKIDKETLCSMKDSALLREKNDYRLLKYFALLEQQSRCTALGSRRSCWRFGACVTVRLVQRCSDFFQAVLGATQPPIQ